MENANKQYISFPKAKITINLLFLILLGVKIATLAVLIENYDSLILYEDRRVVVLIAYIVSVIIYIVALIIIRKKRLYFIVMILNYFLFFLGIAEIFTLAINPKKSKRRKNDLIIILGLSLASYCFNGFMIIFLHISKRTFLYNEEKNQIQIDKIEHIEQQNDQVEAKL